MKTTCDSLNEVLVKGFFFFLFTAAIDFSNQTELFASSRKLVFSIRSQAPFFSFSLIILKLKNDYSGPPLLNKLLQSKWRISAPSIFHLIRVKYFHCCLDNINAIFFCPMPRARSLTIFFARLKQIVALYFNIKGRFLYWFSLWLVNAKAWYSPVDEM